jgi:CheY-like chemotaxis protein
MPARSVTILHVEDDPSVSAAAKTILEDLGWAVETCADGAQARRKIESSARYDVFIFDNGLPGQGGLELMRRARQLPYRRTPCVIHSADDVEPEAWCAGVDAFLRKPQDVGRLAAAVKRLLTKDPGGRK